MLEAFGAGWPFVLDICDIFSNTCVWSLRQANFACDA